MGETLAFDLLARDRVSGPTKAAADSMTLAAAGAKLSHAADGHWAEGAVLALGKVTINYTN